MVEAELSPVVAEGLGEDLLSVATLRMGFLIGRGTCFTVRNILHIS